MRMKAFHKYFGYAVILTVQVAVCSGISRRLNAPIGQDNDSLKYALMFSNLALYAIVLIAGEIIH